MSILVRDVGLEKKQGDMLEVIARLDATSTSVKEGDTVTLAFNIDKLYLFDPNTGDRLITKKHYTQLF